jgi:predicted dehydrogenase
MSGMPIDRIEPEWRIPDGQGRDLGIGIVGCGGIVQQGHLPAYRAAGLRVVAVYDTDVERARVVAREFEIPTVSDSAEALVGTAGVDIVDIAVPPWVQPEIVALALSTGRHILCQKPLALEMEGARQMVEAAESAGVLLAVNQQMRWIAGMVACKDLIARGAIGRATAAQLQVSGIGEWEPWPWLVNSPRLDVMYHSIHYLDSVRSILGEPEWITSIHGHPPGRSPVEGETLTTTVLEYPDGLQVLLTMNHSDLHGRPMNMFRFLGAQGALEGTISDEYDYPPDRADTLTLRRTGTPTIAFDFDTRWLPDAFLGPMSDLMDAIATGRAPQTSGRDNLLTLALVFGAYQSAAERRSVRVADVLSE